MLDGKLIPEKYKSGTLLVWTKEKLDVWFCCLVKKNIHPLLWGHSLFFSRPNYFWREAPIVLFPPKLLGGKKNNVVCLCVKQLYCASASNLYAIVCVCVCVFIFTIKSFKQLFVVVVIIAIDQCVFRYSQFYIVQPIVFSNRNIPVSPLTLHLL